MSCAGCNRLAVEPGVTLEISRQLVCSSCPEWKDECAARHVLDNYPTREARLAMLEGIKKKAGEAAANKIRDDVMALWHHRKVSSGE